MAHYIAQQVSSLYCEAFDIDKADEWVSYQFMDLADIDKHWKEEDNNDIKHGMESQFKWNCHDEYIPMASNLTQHLGKYSATTNKYDARDKERVYEVKWNQRDRQVLRTKINNGLLFALSTQDASYE